MAEREKRRATTFRTSRGAIVNVAAPQIYLPPGITEDQIREALREELVLEYLSEYTLTRNLGKTWLSMSRAWGGTYMLEADPETNFPRAASGYREAVLPVSLYSKRIFEYGWYMFMVQLPPDAEPNWNTAHLGLEPAKGAMAGLTSFKWYKPSVTMVILDSANGGGTRINVSALVPVPSAGFNVWTIKVNRASVEFYANSTLFVSPTLIGILQSNPQADSYIVRATGPYVLGQTGGPNPTHAPAIIEVSDLKSAAAYGVKPGFILRSLSVLDGDPAPPRTLHPITGGVNWEGTVVAGASITSDGIPVAGYKHKTVYFKTTGAGTLDISVDYGDNAYDSLTPTPLVVTANQLLSYPTENDGLWLRLIFTPTTPPKTITRARVMMSD